jgi:CHAT domain-containing protein
VQELYQRLVEMLTASGESEQAWAFLERDKARSFLESLRGRHFAASGNEAASAASRPRQLAQLEQQILTLRLSLSPENESTLRGSGRSTDALHTKLLALENEFALARQQSSLNASRATQPMALAPLTLAAAKKLLPPRTALIEYAVLQNDLAAFVVTRDFAKELHWSADTAALPGMLLALRARLASPPRPGDNLDARLASVSDVLLGPVIAALPPAVNRLVIVPTQALAAIPFGALPVPTDGKDSGPLMIDRYSIAYLPSASTLEFLHFGTPSASPDLFLGAIGDVAVENMPALPGTLAETAAIQKLYPQSTRLTGRAFTHEAAVSALTQHREVHFATHGLFEEQAPLFSSIVTAPAAGQPSRLSLYELTDLHLKARLVILSACETDRGKMTGGDEAAGLTRTFLQAGAETVVSSLWKVNDESTALLMESLHAHLRAGELTPDALRHAELEVRRKFPQPYYWAAFVDTGIR